MATKEIKPKRPPKTVKEKIFVKEYIANHGNATQAALKAYDTDNPETASEIGRQNLAKLGFDHYYERAGLTDEQIAKNITEAAYANKDDPADWATRLKAHELAIKIMGKFAPTKTELTGKDGAELRGLILVKDDNSQTQ